MNSYLWPFPIKWNSHLRNCEFFHKKRHIFSFLIGESFTFFVGTGCSGYLLIKQLLFPSAQFSILNYIIFGISVAGSLFVGLCSVCFIISGAPLADLINALIDLETSLKMKKVSIKRTFFSKNSRNRLSSQSIDFIGIILNLMVYTFTAIPLALPFVVILGLDPLYFIFRDLYTVKTKFLVILQFFFRMVLQTYLIFGACRTGAIAMILTALGAKIVLSCEAGIRRYSGVQGFIQIGTFTRALKLYSGYYVLIECLGISLVTSMALGILLAGLVLEIMTVFVLIRMSYLFYLALPVYLGCFIGAIGIPIAAHIELPEGVKVYGNTLETIRIWKLAMAVVLQRRYYQRLLHALQPCSFYAGIAHTKLFPIRKSTTTTYYSSVIYYVITVLISVPEFDATRLINLNPRHG